LDEWQVYGTTAAGLTARRVKGASVVLSNKIVLDNQLFSATPELELVSIMATGTNNVDLIAARTSNVIVSNAVAYATPSVVQHCINLMLALATSGRFLHA